MGETGEPASVIQAPAYDQAQEQLRTALHEFLPKPLLPDQVPDLQKEGATTANGPDTAPTVTTADMVIIGDTIAIGTLAIFGL